MALKYPVSLVAVNEVEYVETRSRIVSNNLCSGCDVREFFMMEQGRFINFY